MDYTFEIAMLILCVAAGTVNIGFAVQSLKAHRYFQFGFHLMFSISPLTLMIKHLILM